MSTKNIIDAIVENDADKARTLVIKALSEKAMESLQAHKAELGATYFIPKEE